MAVVSAEDVVQTLLTRLQPLLHDIAFAAAKNALTEAGLGLQGGTDLGEVDPDKKLEVGWKVWKPVEMKHIEVTLARGTVRVERTNIVDNGHVAEAQAVLRSPRAPGPFSAVFRLVDSVTHSTVGPDLPLFGHVRGSDSAGAVAIGVPVDFARETSASGGIHSAASAPVPIAVGIPVPSSASAPAGYQARTDPSGPASPSEIPVITEMASVDSTNLAGSSSTQPNTGVASIPAEIPPPSLPMEPEVEAPSDPKAVWHEAFVTFFAAAIEKAPWPAELSERAMIDILWRYAEKQKLNNDKKEIVLDDTLSVLFKNPVDTAIPLSKLIRYVRTFSSMYTSEDAKSIDITP